MFQSKTYGIKHPNWCLGSAERLAGLRARSFHHGFSSSSLLTISSCKWAQKWEMTLLLSASLWSGRKWWCLVHLNWCQCKEQQETKEQYFLLPVYLYLLGILLTDTQSNLELGLFIHLHGRRWLGSNRDFIMLLCFFKVPCVQGGLRGTCGFKQQPVVNAIYDISGSSANLHSLKRKYKREWGKSKHGIVVSSNCKI